MSGADLAHPLYRALHGVVADQYGLDVASSENIAFTLRMVVFHAEREAAPKAASDPLAQGCATDVAPYALYSPAAHGPMIEDRLEAESQDEDYWRGCDAAHGNDIRDGIVK